MVCDKTLNDWVVSSPIYSKYPGFSDPAHSSQRLSRPSCSPVTTCRTWNTNSCTAQVILLHCGCASFWNVVFVICHCTRCQWQRKILRQFDQFSTGFRCSRLGTPSLDSQNGLRFWSILVFKIAHQFVKKLSHSIQSHPNFKWGKQNNIETKSNYPLVN